MRHVCPILRKTRSVALMPGPIAFECRAPGEEQAIHLQEVVFAKHFQPLWDSGKLRDILHRRNQFVSEPLEAIISVCPLMPHHLHVH